MTTFMGNSKIREFFNWWGEELANMLPGSKFISIKKNASDAVIKLNREQCLLTWSGGERAIDCGKKFISAQVVEEYDKLVEDDKKLKISSCDLQISEKMILRRTVTLPLATEENIENVVAYEIDKYTPFNNDDIYFDVKIQKRDKTEKKLTVLLSVIKKQALEEIVEFAQASELSINNVYITDSTDNEIIEELSFVGGVGGRDQQRQKISANKYLVILFLFLSLCALVIPIAKNYWIAQQYEVRILEAREEAAEVRELQSVYQSMRADAKRVSRLNGDNIRLIDLLNELTKIIPDDTSLSRFSLEDDVIRIQGVSLSASELISILDSSNSFSEVKFVAPVTQNSDTGKENFTIEIKLNTGKYDNASVL
jgi:general secretion pathway protein L